VVLLGGTLSLSACGGQDTRAAAIVNGTSISDKDIQNVAVQVNTLATTQQQKLTSSTVLLSLILAPYVLAESSRAGKGVTEAQARQAIAKVAKPSAKTVEFVRMQLAIQSLDEAAKTSILTRLGTAKITVNPRYGTFDARQVALVPVASNWIKAASTSAVAK